MVLVVLSFFTLTACLRNLFPTFKLTHLEFYLKKSKTYFLSDCFVYRVIRYLMLLVWANGATKVRKSGIDFSFGSNSKTCNIYDISSKSFKQCQNCFMLRHIGCKSKREQWLAETKRISTMTPLRRQYFWTHINPPLQY